MLNPKIMHIAYKVSIDDYPVNVCDLDMIWKLCDYDPDKELDAVDDIDDIEYNGHFGNYVLFNAKTDEARDEFLKVLDQVLRRTQKEYDKLNKKTLD